MNHPAYHEQQHDRQTFARVATVARSVNCERTQRELGQYTSRRSLAPDPRGEFLAMVLHELRNPLSGIQMAIDVLRRADGLGPPPDRLWAGLDKAMGQVKSLTDDLMDLCSTTHPTFQLRSQPMDLAAVAHSVIERRRYDFERKGLWLALQPRPKPVWIMADTERLELVMGNLLDNAAKYTEPGGQVIVSITADSAEAALRVQDTGIGIAPEWLPNVFEPFVREGVSWGRTIRGSGIGLLLVRTLVELHGGRVEACSAGRGQGSTFIVRLPVMEDRAQGNVPDGPAARAEPSGLYNRRSQ